MPRRRQRKYDENGNEIIPKVRASKKFTDDQKQSIRGSVHVLSQVRHRAYVFPFEETQNSLEEILKSTYPQAYLDNLMAIWNDPHYSEILRTSEISQIQVDAIRFNFRVPVTSPYLGVHTIKESNPYYDKLLEWAGNVNALKGKERATNSLLSPILDRITTSGQLVRAWPEIIHYMPDDIAESLGQSVRASRLPKSLDMLDINDKRVEATEFLAFMSLVKGTPSRSRLTAWIE